jgi:hypothetical protein
MRLSNTLSIHPSTRRTFLGSSQAIARRWYGFCSQVYMNNNSLAIMTPVWNIQQQILSLALRLCHSLQSFASFQPLALSCIHSFDLPKAYKKCSQYEDLYRSRNCFAPISWASSPNARTYLPLWQRVPRSSFITSRCSQQTCPSRTSPVPIHAPRGIQHNHRTDLLPRNLLKQQG